MIMDSLEKKVPPPLVMLSCAGLMWLLRSPQKPKAKQSAAVGLFTGIFTALSGIRAFSRVKTTVNPHHPENASSLVTSGIYQYTRNPMYLGLLIVLLSWARYLNSPRAALIGTPLFMAYITRFQIQPEERTLTAIFGRDYLSYKTQVNRWV